MFQESNAILEVKNLHTYFLHRHGTVNVVEGVSFSLAAGEVLGIVGESGSGKSVTCLSIMRLHSELNCLVEGKIYLNGQDLLCKSEREMQRIRGNHISMIFQEPMTSLNPVYTIGRQLIEPLRIHQKLSRKEAYRESIEMLKKVGIHPPEQRMREYPHQLSGGMRQRVMIAMSLCCNPKILIADEPTTALDVTIQAQIFDLIKQLIKQYDTSVILVTHDLGVARELAQKVIVMYSGTIVEEGELDALFTEPRHPYTRGLLDSIPRLDCKQEQLKVIPGTVPGPYQKIEGCRFHPRCQYRELLCENERPELTTSGLNRRVACHFPLGNTRRNY